MKSNPSRPSSPAQNTFVDDVLAGLSSTPKYLLPKYFYDDRGCELFVEITQLDEYYVSRSELALLQEHGHKIASQLASVNTLLELGGASGTRSELMLSLLPNVERYVPVDVAPEALAYATELAEKVRPDVQAAPILADFSQQLILDPPNSGPNVACYFPGSTIGNFSPIDAIQFLRNLRFQLHGGYLLIGVDLRKSADILERAYDDAQGVTAEFNRNLLRRINSELGANFVLEAFEHVARYDVELGRIEMYLKSSCDQIVEVAGHSFEFRAGESIHTENSYKYSVEGFIELAGAAGWSPIEHWISPNGYFSSHLMRPVLPIK